MNTKKLISALLCLALCLCCLTGCSIFAPADDANKPEVGNDASTAVGKEIKFTESFTITDPADLDFDTRAVLFADVSNPTLQMYTSMGATVNEAYIIIYGKDGKPVAEYDYYLFADEASAGVFTAMAPAMQLTGLVGVNVQGSDMVEATSAMMQAQGLMADDSFDAFVQMYQTVYGYAKK